jgi:MFS family permease
MIVFNKWIIFIVSVVMMFPGGHHYIFETISSDLRRDLHYDYSQINYIAVMNQIGYLFGIVIAIINDYFGARLASLLAAIFMFTGYILFYSVLVSWIHTTHWFVGIFFMIFSMGASACLAAPTATCIKRFKQTKYLGTIIGVLVFGSGISPTISYLFYHYVLHHNLQLYILIVSIICGVLPTITGVVVLGDEKPKPSVAELESQPILTENSVNYATDSPNESPQSPPIIIEKESVSSDNVHPLRIPLTVDFWVISFLMFSGVGTTLLIVNNLGSILHSYRIYNPNIQSLLLCYAIASSTGRVTVGFLYDRLRRVISINTLINVSVLGIGSSILLLLNANNIIWFYSEIILMAFFFGCSITLVTVFLSERYGGKYSAINLSVIRLPFIAGSVTLMIVKSAFYKAYQHPLGEVCLGKECYFPTLIIAVSLCVLAFVVGFGKNMISRRIKA